MFVPVVSYANSEAQSLHYHMFCKMKRFAIHQLSFHGVAFSCVEVTVTELKIISWSVAM